jgi:hypothetical protein
MDIAAITQFATAVMQFVFVVVIGVGYYFRFKVGRDTLDEMRAQRTAVGCPQIVVDDDYDRLPKVDVVVRNVSQGRLGTSPSSSPRRWRAPGGSWSRTCHISSTAWTSLHPEARSRATGTTSTRCCPI